MQVNESERGEFLAFVDTALAGYFRVTDSCKSCAILDFEIVANWRRRGLGRMMMQYMINRFDLCADFSIIVSERNVEAQLFLKAMGFTLRKQYRSDPDNHRYLFWAKREWVIKELASSSSLTQYSPEPTHSSLHGSQQSFG